jgi:hypothetical protein
VDQQARISMLVARAATHLAEWNVPDPEHQARIVALRADWAELRGQLDLTHPFALEEAMQLVKGYTLDAQELMAALIMEPFGDLIDGLADCMGDPFGAFCQPVKDTETLKQQIEADFAWALTPDYDAPDQCGQFWYVSEAKAEPRLGLRFQEPGAELESPLDIGRRIKALHGALGENRMPVSAFLTHHPDHALAVERVEMGQRYPYAEIRDNLIATTCLPIDMLRCKLSFFGAAKFDPKSDRWTRITLCQGAPLASDLQDNPDDWWLPVFAA